METVTKTPAPKEWKQDWEFVGYCYVDAGLIWIGDPCYIMGDDASSRVTSWSDFCDKLYQEDKPLIKADGPYPTKAVYQPLGAGTGIAMNSGWGDGSYPVFIQRNEEGRVMRAIIEFDYAGEDQVDW